MEQSTNVNVEIQDNGFNEEAVRQQIVNEVMAELETKNIKVIPNHYSWEQHILDIVNEFDSLKAKYNKEVEYNKDRYSEHVASEMNRHLTNDYNLEVSDLYRKLDDVQQTDKRWKMHQVEKMQQSEEYQTAKQMAFQEIGYLKGIKDIPMDLLQDIVNPVINAYDVRSLRIMSTMLGGDNTIPGRVVGRAVHDVTTKLNATDSEPFIQGARNYMNTGQLDLRLMALQDNMKKKGK